MARARDAETEVVPAHIHPVYERSANDHGPVLNQVKRVAYLPGPIAG